MSALLVRERCWTHPVREAAARCPSCGRSFCRECVTEHEGQLVCAACLRGVLSAASERRRRSPARFLRRTGAVAARTGALTVSVLSAWLFFHWLAQNLISLPSEFHQSTLWKQLGLPETGGDDDQ